MRTENRNGLLSLSVGMSKAEVLEKMGQWTKRTQIGPLNNPYRSEILPGEGVILEVVFYYTDAKKMDNAITDDELTPVIFRESKLIGWGWNFLDDNVEKYEIRLR
jgi:hypothetical protein